MIQAKPIILPLVVGGEQSTQLYQALFAKIDELQTEISSIKKTKKKNGSVLKSKSEPAEYSEFKSDGKPKSRATDSIKSYDEFLAMQNYFLNRGKIRDWAFWTVGVSLGVRVSDLTALKINSVLERNLSFRRRLRINEKKTGKLNDCLITESIKDALTKYFDSINWKFDMNDYIFLSQKKCKLTPQSGWRIISSAARSLGIDGVIGSHTMRKSFANIALCLFRSTIDMNAMSTVQALLQHESLKTTMKYLGTFNEFSDEARISVSDFVLGKSTLNELKIVGAGTQ